MVRNKKITAKSSTRAAQIAKERSKGKHKITVQNSSKEKGKPLHSVVSEFCRHVQRTTHLSHQITIKADPPPGYTFIPAGNPELTQALKEFSRQGDHKIYAVTVSFRTYVRDLGITTLIYPDHSSRHPARAVKRSTSCWLSLPHPGCCSSLQLLWHSLDQWGQAH